MDDSDLDDETLWAAIDSASAAALSARSLSTTTTNNNNTNTRRHFLSPKLTFPILPSSPSPSISPSSTRSSTTHSVANGEVLQAERLLTDHQQRPAKMGRFSVVEPASPSPGSGSLAVVQRVERTPPVTPPMSYRSGYGIQSVQSPNGGQAGSPAAAAAPLVMVKHVERTPPPTTYRSESRIQSVQSIQSPGGEFCSGDSSVVVTGQQQHSLAGRFPSVELFKEYQHAAMGILEKGDYTMISGNPYIKKSGWRKISFYFNISYEIKDKTIEFDDSRNVQRAEFVVRAHMQGGRFSDGWGSCDRREKRFSKPNHDIPSTAETRAKNRACQDLIGIGEYRPGANAQR